MATMDCSPHLPRFGFFLDTYKVRGQGKMKLSIGFGVAVSVNFSLRGNERLVTFVWTGHI